MKTPTLLALLLAIAAQAQAGPVTGVYPDAVLLEENTRGPVWHIQDDPTCPDRRAIVGFSFESSLTLSFPTPPGPGLRVGEDLQEFRVLVKAGPATTSNVWTAILQEDGELRAVLFNEGAVVEPGRGRFLSFRWDAGALEDPAGSGVELFLVFGGDLCEECSPLPFNRTRVEAVRWEAWTRRGCSHACRPTEGGPGR